MKPSEKANHIFLGVSTMFLALWISSFVMSFVEPEDWYSFPLFITFCGVFGYGLYRSVYGATEGR